MRHGHRKPEALDDVIQTRFQKPEKVFTGQSRHTFGLFKIMAELLFRETGDTLGLLLFAKTASVFGNFDPLVHMHARS